MLAAAPPDAPSNVPVSPYLTVIELKARWKCSSTFIAKLRQVGRLTTLKWGERSIRLKWSEVLEIENA